MTATAADEDIDFGPPRLVTGDDWTPEDGPPDVPPNFDVPEAHALEQPAAARHEPAQVEASRAIDGATFITAEPDTIPAAWGSGDQVLWANGEGLMIVGPDGVGKTTLMQQLVLARLGLRTSLLGQPVQTTGRRVLYIAGDRPRQAARSFGRMVTAADHDTLRDKLVVWRGPLPFNITEDRNALADLCQQLDATDLFIDSLKDVAVDLAKDETGSRVNIALQEVIARDIELTASHHQRKEGRDGSGKPKRLADVYGSRWLTAGMGSVVCLWGEPGDLVVEFLHLKQPAEDVGPYDLIHDHARGTTTVSASATLDSILHEAGAAGISAADIACRIHKTDAATRNQREKVRRQLERMIDQGDAARHSGPDNVIVYTIGLA